MMDAIKEESVGFLFNLEVQVEEQETPPEAAAPATPAGDSPTEQEQPQLDTSMLEAAQHAHERAGDGRPHIRAKGLDRDTGARPLVYSSPELGSDSPSIQTTTETTANGSGEPSAKRQQARANPNRGSRGNRSRRKR
jgi:preprotein translocase subunit SecA